MLEATEVLANRSLSNAFVLPTMFRGGRASAIIQRLRNNSGSAGFPKIDITHTGARQLGADRKQTKLSADFPI